MPDPTPTNPAEIAAKAALDQMTACLDNNKCFIFEAGPGAGKTYSLIDALKRLLAQRGVALVRHHQQIACITYTNAAKGEIEARTDRHPAIRSDTIHGFCWSLLKEFQPHLRSLLPLLERWPDALAEAGGLSGQRVEYDLGFLHVDKDVASIRHDDVLTLMVASLAQPKFRQVLMARYPILLVDEYQDTDANFVEALKSHFLDAGDGPLIGLFGDEWQKIYGNGCGKVTHPKLEVIGKEANFRSTRAIVDPLNKMRPGLPQMVRDPEAPGEATIFHTNMWKGQRRSGNHWKGDVSPEAAHSYLEFTTAELLKAGWEFSSTQTKVLMLTHNILAKEQGYPGVAAAFSNNDAFIKKEDPHIEYLVDVVEPACAAFLAKRYGKMFEALGKGAPAISSHVAKVAWAETMSRLVEIRQAGDVGQVIDHIRASGPLRLPEKVEDRERQLKTIGPDPQEGEPSWVPRLRKLRAVPYQEIIALDRYIDGLTPFATKHGVKGAEFENVLVVVGRGWNQYNFEQMLCWYEIGVPADKHEAFVRNRNLFYVACSRPKRRLAVLFTQELTSKALATLTKWFGASAIRPLPHM